jgi:hypothetical protein
MFSAYFSASSLQPFARCLRATFFDGTAGLLSFGKYQTGGKGNKLAEGVGFEPTVGCPTLDFESSALNRTQPPFPVPRIVDVNLRRAIMRRRF